MSSMGKILGKRHGVGGEITACSTCYKTCCKSLKYDSKELWLLRAEDCQDWSKKTKMRPKAKVKNKAKGKKFMEDMKE